LYAGKSLPGFTEEAVKEIREKALDKNEGMEGISPRYIQDKVSNAIVGNAKLHCVNPFMVINELEEGLKHHSLINNEELRKKYRDLLSVVREEYEDILKNEFQKAVVADEDAIKNLCSNYIDNLKAYTQSEKVKNDYTGEMEEPDEKLMRSVEEKADVPEAQKDEFRQSIMNYIGALAIDKKTFDYTTNERLHKALELKLFEDQKDSIKLKSIISSVVDDEAQKKIDVVKERMIEKYGYCDECATATLKYIASIFARGDAKKEEEEEKK
jgi:serine protein kinase